MNENKPYVELLMHSSNPHTSFLSLSQTIIEQKDVTTCTKKNALQKVVEAYEEICRQPQR
ncbi:hypothetical protein [Salibacterium halotolerans]|uniref:Uncharacterized protein n=1 Tax=Salibacterium halotolerans TaxID=1884432 RepID=A0A1I5LFI4_9BACI|nr:hypothetical protein [Salibacterium halotolerans]SFO95965.1 hypothetical protein SAMN05518683_101223 [Salibacterium halotolerans]